MTKKRIIIIVSVILLVGIIAIAVYYSSHKEDPTQAYLKDAVKITHDIDTGELVTEDPNLANQTEDNRTIVILGIDKLVEENVLQEQINFVKDKLNEFSKQRLKNAYSTITIRPEGLVNNDDVITTTIRLGQSNEILPITITASRFGSTRIVIQDPDNKHGGQYDSGEVVFGAE